MDHDFYNKNRSHSSWTQEVALCNEISMPSRSGVGVRLDLEHWPKRYDVQVMVLAIHYRRL